MMVWDSRNVEIPRPVVIPLAGDAVNRSGESHGVDAGPTTAAGAATIRHWSGAPAGNRKGG